MWRGRHFCPARTGLLKIHLYSYVVKFLVLVGIGHATRPCAARTHLFSSLYRKRSASIHFSAHRSSAALLSMTNRENPQNPSLWKSQWQCFSFSWFNNATAGDNVKSKHSLVRLKQIPSNPFLSSTILSTHSPSDHCLSNPSYTSLDQFNSFSLIIAALNNKAAFSKDRYRERQSRTAYSYNNYYYYSDCLSKDPPFSWSLECHARYFVCIL
jgi:hypothetical protein